MQEILDAFYAQAGDVKITQPEARMLSDFVSNYIHDQYAKMQKSAEEMSQRDWMSLVDLLEHEQSRFKKIIGAFGLEFGWRKAKKQIK